MPTDRSKLEYEIKTGADNQLYVTIRAAGNREALARSEGYKSRNAALNMIECVRRDAAEGEIDDQT